MIIRMPARLGDRGQDDSPEPDLGPFQPKIGPAPDALTDPQGIRSQAKELLVNPHLWGRPPSVGRSTMGRRWIPVMLAVAIVLQVATLAPAPSLAQGRTVTWKFTLDFLIQGPQAPFVIALEKGYYAKEGINLTMDRGFGSADAVTKIASGAYDLGYADINSMIEFNARNPGKELVAIAILLNSPPFAILTLRRGNNPSAPGVCFPSWPARGPSTRTPWSG